MPTLRQILGMISRPVRWVESKTYAVMRSRMFTPAILFLVFLAVLQFEQVQAAFPYLSAKQMRFNQLVYQLDLRQPLAREVVLVEVDDSTFWHPPLSGIQPTNRKFLADLAKAAANAGASVVAIDFRLSSPFPFPGDDKIRKKDNEYLLGTIRNITRRKVPVILTCSFSDNGKGEWERVPDIFADASLPAGVTIGYVNLPIDIRLIPLSMKAWEWNGMSQRDFHSFAFQIADAYQTVFDLKSSIGEDPTIKSAIMNGRVVYGGFLNNSAFLRVPASKLLRQSDEVGRLLRHRIVIIGGVWHQFGESRGPLVDEFFTPVGPLPGLYIHANYVEALFDRRFAAVIPRWILASAVLGVAAFVSILFFSAKGPLRRTGILALFWISWLITYRFLAYYGQYLDFTTPLGVCFFQLFLTAFEDLRQLTVARIRHRPLGNNVETAAVKNGPQPRMR